MWTSTEILKVLDDCCETFTFPMLDNGYVYLAATRLSLHRSREDWAIVIEVFGFSPRTGIPDIHVYTFGSRLRSRDELSDPASAEAHENHLRKNPHNESSFFNPIHEGEWQDSEEEIVASEASTITVRNQILEIPETDAFEECEIELEEPPNVQIFELCRWLAASHRDLVLATPEERRTNVPQDLVQLLVLDEWCHPDVVNEERPSSSTTFQELAEVLVHGDVTRYKASQAPNTHWSNWPDGGSL